MHSGRKKDILVHKNLARPSKYGNHDRRSVKSVPEYLKKKILPIENELGEGVTQSTIAISYFFADSLDSIPSRSTSMKNQIMAGKWLKV